MQALQDTGSGEDAVKAGMALLLAYQRTQRRDDGLAQVARLLDLPPPAPVLEAPLLKQVLDALVMLGDTSALPRIEPRVHTLKGEVAVPAKERAQLLHALAALQTRVPQLEQAVAVLDAGIRGQPKALLSLSPDSQTSMRSGCVLAVPSPNQHPVRPLRLSSLGGTLSQLSRQAPLAACTTRASRFHQRRYRCESLLG